MTTPRMPCARALLSRRNAVRITCARLYGKRTKRAYKGRAIGCSDTGWFGNLQNAR